MMITELTNQFQKTLDSELDKKQQDINVKEIIEKKLKLQLDDL
jgi:hypothetical protein